MGKERKGCIVERAGKLYVRIAYTDSLGKRRELMRRAKDKKHARELKKQLVKQLDSPEGNQRAELDAQKLTFAKVADRYEEARLIPAQYVGDQKVAGLRSLRTPKAYLKRLVEHFGAARLRSMLANLTTTAKAHSEAEQGSRATSDSPTGQPDCHLSRRRSD